MSRHASPTAIGLFVSAAFAAAFAGLIAVSSGGLFARTAPCVFYFKGSVAGLAPGAPVEFRGVRIGAVTDIRMIYDADRNEVRIPVFAELDPDRVASAGGATRSAECVLLRSGIATGLRAQIRQQSILTGQQKVVLDFFPGAAAAVPEVEDGRIVVPTVSGAFDRMVEQFETLPLREIVVGINDAVQRLSALLAAPETAMAVTNLNDALTGLARAAHEVEAARLAELSGELRQTLTQVRASWQPQEVSGLVSNAQAVLTQLERAAAAVAASAPAAAGELADASRRMANAVERTADTRAELTATLNELAAAARAVRSLAETLDQHPESLLKGKP